MERDYFSRGERKTVEVLDDVVAIQVSTDPRGATPEAAIFGAPARHAEQRLNEGSLEAFRNANWVFVSPTPEVSRRVNEGLSVRDTEQVGQVVRRGDGSVGVATRKLNVQLSESISADQAQQVLADAGLTVSRQLRFAPNLFEVDAPAGEDSLAASVRLHDDSRFTFAEPAFIEHIPARFTPSDPQFDKQWQWTNVHAEQAWDLSRGAGVRVAVIDNGFNAQHPDLRAGVSAASGFFRPQGTFARGTAQMPAGDHGTFCAGMVGARSDNGAGGCGAAPEAELILIACLNDQVGTQTTLARAVAYAADPSTEVPGASAASGADILVSSLGPNGADWALTQTLALALEFAASSGRQGRGLAIFWAASNGRNVDVLKDEVVSHADVIAVVRSDRDDRENNAARGPEVELIAPGVDVFSTTGDGGYGTSTGTSFAAPCAAGCAALALALNGDLTRDELRDIMRGTADRIGGVVYDAQGHNDDYGFGRVNALEAAKQAQRSGAAPIEAFAPAMPAAGV